MTLLAPRSPYARCHTLTQVIHEQLTIEKGMITTVHNITGTQSLVDMVNEKKKDLRRARSGMLNLAPTSTGSATAVRPQSSARHLRKPMLGSGGDPPDPHLAFAPLNP